MAITESGGLNILRGAYFIIKKSNLNGLLLIATITTDVYKYLKVYFEIIVCSIIQIFFN
jgi:hypothetical protein